MEKFLSIKEASTIIGINPETLRRWDKSGKFKSVRHPINNYRIYSETQILEFVKDFNSEIDYLIDKKIDVKLIPYFQTEWGSLYNIDVIDFLGSLEDNSVDLIFADPPYNINKAEWDKFTSQKEYLDWSAKWIRQAHRVLKNTGSLFICGFSEILADIKWSVSETFKGCKWLIWFYRNKGNLGNDWGRSHESILHFRKGKDFIFNIDCVRIPYNQHTLKYPKRTQANTSQYSNKNKSNNYIWEPNPLGAKPKDVLEIPTISNSAWEKYPHLTQKPVELLRKIILSSSNQDSLIVDPFGGSGTSFAVAEALKRNWLGCEIDEAYCRIIKNRISDKKHVERILKANDEYESNDRRKKLRGKHIPKISS